MKRRGILLTLIAITVILLSALILAGCTNNNGETGGIPVTDIRVEDTDIYMAPSGVPSVYQLNPVVYPKDASNKRVSFELLDTADSRYLTVTTTGRIEAREVKDEAVIIRVFSQDNRNIYVDVSVFIEETSVTKITFNPTVVTVYLHEEPVKINPIFYPAHAINGRNVNYTALEPSIATVSADGYVTPVKVGKTTVKVSTPATVLETPIDGFVQIDVRYAPLAYNLTLSSAKSVMKQISGSPELIELTINSFDPYCDPEPRIRWFLDGTAIQQEDARDNKILSYRPNLPYGNYVIRAELEDASGELLELKSDVLSIFEPYNNGDHLDMDILNKDDDGFNAGDIVALIVNWGEQKYPPESFNWYLKEVNTSGLGTRIAATAEKTLNYELRNSGDFIITCVPVIKGVAVTALKVEIALGDVAAIEEGSDVFGVYVDGIKQGADVYPHVKWNVLPYKTEFKVEIKKESGTVAAYDSAIEEHKEFFTDFGFKIPAGVATLQENFEVRVRSGRYSTYTSWVSYEGGSIREEYYDLLEVQFNGYNGYIVNVEELGEMVNFISLFRPEEIYKDANGDEDYAGYKVRLYTDIVYDESLIKTYPVKGDLDLSGSAPAANIRNLIKAAFNTYGDTGSFSMASSVQQGQKDVAVTFIFDELPAEFITAPSSPYSLSPVELHYGVNERLEDILPIDSLTRTISVTTSNQLYYAATLGYRPIPVAGSQAAGIYSKARSVLRRIIGYEMSDAEKVHAIYDFLTGEVLYDDELQKMFLNNTATADSAFYDGFLLEGVFDKGKAVCDGLSKAFNLMTAMEGIRSVKIGGESGGTGHAWNKVLVDGSWYGIDTTWGRENITLNNRLYELPNHGYLLISDAVLSANRITYGVYEATAATSHNVFTETEVAEGVYNIVRTEAELETYLEGYLVPRMALNSALWFELKVNYPVTGNAFPQYAQGVLERIGDGGFRIVHGHQKYGSWLLYVTTKNQ